MLTKSANKRRNNSNNKPFELEYQNELSMMHLHDKGKALAQSVHKLDEKPWLLLSVQDLHNLCHLAQQCRLTLYKSTGIGAGKMTKQYCKEEKR